MDVSHSVSNCVYDTRSGFSLNNKVVVKFKSFCQVIYIGLIRCEGKGFSHCHVGIAENFILNNIILFCYTHGVVVGYTIKVLCCNWTYYCLAGGTANYVIVTDVIVIKPAVIKPILFINVSGPDVIKPILFICHCICFFKMQHNFFRHLTLLAMASLSYMPMALSTAPLHSLGQNKWNTVQKNFLDLK